MLTRTCCSHLLTFPNALQLFNKGVLSYTKVNVSSVWEKIDINCRAQTYILYLDACRARVRLLRRTQTELGQKNVARSPCQYRKFLWYCLKHSVGYRRVRQSMRQSDTFNWHKNIINTCRVMLRSFKVGSGKLEWETHISDLRAFEPPSRKNWNAWMLNYKNTNVLL